MGKLLSCMAVQLQEIRSWARHLIGPWSRCLVTRSSSEHVPVLFFFFSLTVCYHNEFFFYHFNHAIVLFSAKHSLAWIARSIMLLRSYWVLSQLFLWFNCELFVPKLARVRTFGCASRALFREKDWQRPLFLSLISAPYFSQFDFTPTWRNWARFA